MSSSSLVFALITIVVFITQSGSNAEANEATDVVKQQLNQPVTVALTITDWATFMKTFNKHYSSLPQMLVRQSLFMTRIYEVFITRVKHFWNFLSYYTTINKYSDATREEVEMLTEGDTTSLNESDFTDDQTVDKFLGDAQQMSHRLKRAANENGNDDDDDDDIWYSKPQERPTEVPDIPEERLGLIADEAQNERSQLETIAGLLNPLKAVNRVQSAVNTAFDWLSMHDNSVSTKHDDDDEEPKQVIVHKDWRESGCIGMPRDQGYCESCYAFSSTAFAEWAYCRHKEGKFTRLSPQYVINCASRFNSMEFFGCNRGPIRLVPDFFKHYGLELEQNVPYVEETEVCHLDESSPKESWGSIRPIVEQTIRMKNNTERLDKALKVRPVILSMFTPSSFVGYGGGFIDDCNRGTGGHAVLLVGSMSENGVDYLLAQNSLGAFWGLQGYFKIKRTPEFFHKCVKHFMVPTLKFSNP